MDTVIRNIDERDMDYILELNETNVEVLSPMDEDRFRYLVSVSELAIMVEADDKPAAFLLALREGVSDYDSENYIWFSNNYERFLYVDRIVIDERFRGRGIGRKLYEEVFKHAADTKVPTVTAEVDIIPYNDPSLKFHAEMGFREVGQQIIRGGRIKVSLQIRPIEDAKKIELIPSMEYGHKLDVDVMDFPDGLRAKARKRCGITLDYGWRDIAALDEKGFDLDEKLDFYEKRIYDLVKLSIAQDWTCVAGMDKIKDILRRHL